jgi:hypothetical protein
MIPNVADLKKKNARTPNAVEVELRKILAALTDSDRGADLKRVEWAVVDRAVGVVAKAIEDLDAAAIAKATGDGGGEALPSGEAEKRSPFDDLDAAGSGSPEGSEDAVGAASRVDGSEPTTGTPEAASS